MKVGAIEAYSQANSVLMIHNSGPPKVADQVFNTVLKANTPKITAPVKTYTSSGIITPNVLLPGTHVNLKA